MKRINTAFLWVIRPYILVCRKRRFGATCCGHLQGYKSQTVNKRPLQSLLALPNLKLFNIRPAKF